MLDTGCVESRRPREMGGETGHMANVYGKATVLQSKCANLAYLSLY